MFFPRLRRHAKWMFVFLAVALGGGFVIFDTRDALTDRPGGPPLPHRLLELLVQVQAKGSLQSASQALGLSYRHAWDLVRQGEAHFGQPLLHMARGRGSRLSPLGDKLVWADHRHRRPLHPRRHRRRSSWMTR